MSKRKYKSKSLYHTDRKKYWEQKTTGSEMSQKSNGLSLTSEDYEKMVGFAGEPWTRSGYLGRDFNYQFGVNTNLLNRFPNLAGKGTLYRNKDGYITIQETVWLCQKAWEEFQLFRNTVEAMVEFSVSKIRLSCKNKSAKNFCETWLKAIKIDNLAEQFYRELYRSCNVFIYPIKGEIKAKDVQSLKIYGSSASIPVKYTILNPAQITIHGGITNDSEIYKVLSPYEIKRLRNPQAETEKALYNNLDPEIQKKIKDYSGTTTNSYIYVPLKDVNAVFYQKQDYEYFATPLFYGVLDDIELKLEMKKADKTILQTLENVILLVTLGGYKVGGDEMPPNPEQMAHLRKLFNNEKARRVLISDYTTKVDYVIPDISKVVGKEKYSQVNEDIREGLQSIFGSNEKFSNQMTKVKVFCERLKTGQCDFKDWLEGELGNVCKAMGFTETPKVKMASINLEDKTQMNRVYTRMSELGFLTPSELNVAIEDGILPTEEESVENQRKYLKQKEDDLYYPQMFYNNNYNEMGDGSAKENGRPNGATQPLSSPRQQRVVGNIEGVSLKKVSECFKEYEEMESSLVSKAKEIYKKENLTESQISLINSISQGIVQNYPKSDWIEASLETLEKKQFKNNASMQEQIEEICENFDLDDNFLGAIVYHSQTKAPVSQKK